MTSLHHTIINEIIALESGYTGDSNYGITRETARKHGYSGEMRVMPTSVAFDIYTAICWKPINGDRLVSQGVSKTTIRRRAEACL